MKRIKLLDIKWFMLLLLMCVFIISFCSKEDLFVYEEVEIIKVGVYYCFYFGDKDVIMGENIVVEKELDCINNIDLEYGVVIVVFIIFVVGGKFIEVECVKVLLSNFVVYVNVFIVVCVILLDGLFKFGVFVDWIWEYKYSVMVVDGIKKIWIVKVILNK